jgi:hypothetical protein
MLWVLLVVAQPAFRQRKAVVASTNRDGDLLVEVGDG